MEKLHLIFASLDDNAKVTQTIFRSENESIVELGEQTFAC